MTDAPLNFVRCKFCEGNLADTQHRCEGSGLTDEWWSAVKEGLSGPVLYEEYVEAALQDTYKIIETTATKWNRTPEQVGHLIQSFERRIANPIYEYDQGDLVLVDYDMIHDLVKIFRGVYDSLEEIRTRELG